MKCFKNTSYAMLGLINITYNGHSNKVFQSITQYLLIFNKVF